MRSPAARAASITAGEQLPLGIGDGNRFPAGERRKFRLAALDLRAQLARCAPHEDGVVGGVVADVDPRVSGKFGQLRSRERPIAASVRAQDGRAEARMQRRLDQLRRLPYRQ